MKNNLRARKNTKGKKKRKTQNIRNSIIIIIIITIVNYSVFYILISKVQTQMKRGYILCGIKMPTRCKRGFLLQILLLAQHVSATTMPIIRSSRVLYGGCCLWYFVLWFSSCWSGAEVSVMCPVCRMLVNQQLENHRQQPLYNTLQLLMMGIVLSEICWASNKICNKNLCCI